MAAGAVVASITAAGLTPAGFRLFTSSTPLPSDDNLFTAIIRFLLPLSLGAIVIWQAHLWLPLMPLPMPSPHGDGEASRSGVDEERDVGTEERDGGTGEVEAEPLLPASAPAPAGSDSSIVFVADDHAEPSEPVVAHREHAASVSSSGHGAGGAASASVSTTCHSCGQPQRTV